MIAATIGYGARMSEQQTWHLERNAPVRADAEGMFVPVAEIPEAKVGDVVVASGHDGGEQRTGTIVEEVERDDELFHRIDLEA